MEEPTPRLSDVILEFTDTASLGVDDKGATENQLILMCAQVLGTNAVDPDSCRLVITGDFVESVRQRVEDDWYRDNFDTNRNRGTVAGKTMPMPDGSIDVLLIDSFFYNFQTQEAQAEAVFLALRTTLHESQHVAMRQAGEADPDLSALPRGRMNLEAVADEVIQEYRAERAVQQQVETDMPGMDPLEILEHWHASLVRVASVEYQKHRDVELLWYGIVQETQTAWKLLAYEAAKNLDGADPDAALPVEITGHQRWQQMVGPHWGRFVDILRLVPSGNIRTERSKIDDVRQELADEFTAWTLRLGFEAVDSDDGSFGFYIRHWRVLQA